MDSRKIGSQTPKTYVCTHSSFVTFSFLHICNYYY
jgi:hypothetical protein